MFSWIRTQFKRLVGSHQATGLRQRRSQRAGFTLIELLVASFLVSIVILISWSGLISLMNMSAVAEAKSSRQLEVNRAIDFVSEEIRQARYVNGDGINVVDGSATEIVDLLNAQGFDLTKLGNRGELALYLEIPSATTPPATCPAGGPNAGLPPPSPSEFDQVIYDVRDSSSEWLPPRTVMRYGRIHDIDGSFNPCETPLGSDPIADSLVDDATKAPTCTGVLTGGPGFYACGENNQTRLTFQSTFIDDSVNEFENVVTSRVQPIAEAPVANSDCSNEANLRALNNDTPAKITFVNNAGKSIFMYELDAAGQRQFYGGWVLPGYTVTYDTFVTHPWIAADPDDNSRCLAVFMPTEGHSTAIVK